MIIGTAGHVDHGKTALVKALTGIDADRLAEEKRRGITIDLGYAYTETLGFVDVPGHERFVHTMLAGAGGIDAALLVVALPEGVMPQTREHVQILDLLGIDRGVVALTMTDLAGERVPAVTSELRQLLAGTGLDGATIIAVSSTTGQGIGELSRSLLDLAPRRRDADGHPRLAVDRAFTLPGAGLIVTGTLVAGRIALEDRLMLSPAGLEVRVRGLHAQNRPATRAEAGQRVALNIAGPRLSKDMVNRGDWVVHPDLHAPVDRLDARIHLLAEEKRPVRQDTPVHLHLGAAHVMARAFPLDVGRLEPGSSALVRLVLDRPIGALTMDRLVLRDAGATRTIGGGVVVDPFPPRRGGRTPARMAQLAACEAPEAVDALRGVLALSPHWTDQTVFFRSRNLPTATQPDVLDAAGAIAVGGLAMTQVAFDRLRGLVIDALADRHRTAADKPGLQAERLRALIAERPPRLAFQAVIDTLLRSGAVTQDGPWLRLPGHAVSLTAQDQHLWDAAHALLATDRFRPPRTRDLAQALHVPETAMRGLLKRLQRMGRLVEVAPDRFFLREALAAMLAIAADAEATEQGLTAAVFRDRLTIGRNVAIQILEFFDRSGVTIRSGDTRHVRPDRAAFFGSPPAIPPHAG